MAIALRASAEARNTATTTHTVTTPAGAASGDVLIGVWYANGSAAWTQPAGWTVLVNEDGAASGSMLVCRLVLSGAPGGSYAATSAASETAWGHIMAFTGVDTTTPEDATATHSHNTSGTYTTPTITTVTNNAVLLCIWGRGANVTITVDGALTPIDNGAAGPAYATGYETIATAGATGTRTATGYTGDNFGASVAIRPAGGGGGGTTLPANSLALMGAGI